MKLLAILLTPLVLAVGLAGIPFFMILVAYRVSEGLIQNGPKRAEGADNEKKGAV